MKGLRIFREDVKREHSGDKALVVIKDHDRWLQWYICNALGARYDFNTGSHTTEEQQESVLLNILDEENIKDDEIQKKVVTGIIETREYLAGVIYDCVRKESAEHALDSFYQVRGLRKVGFDLDHYFLDNSVDIRLGRLNRFGKFNGERL